MHVDDYCILLRYGGICAKELKVHEQVLTTDVTCVIIKEVQVEQLSEPETTYNFEVEDFHTYYVAQSKILTHNKCWKWGEGGRGSVDNNVDNNIDYHYS